MPLLRVLAGVSAEGRCGFAHLLGTSRGLPLPRGEEGERKCRISRSSNVLT